MNHSFNVEVAKDVGVLAATVFNSIGFWVENARANERNFFDGRYWTYNSVKAWAEQFPYATGGQMRTALSKLKDAGYVETGNYSKNHYDRTLWYTLTEKGEAAFYGEGIVGDDELICKNLQMGAQNLTTDINTTDISTTNDLPDTNKSAQKKKNQDSLIEEYTPNPQLREALHEFVRMRKLIRAPMTQRALTNLFSKLDRLAASDEEKVRILDQSITNCWKGVFPLKEEGTACRDSQPQTESFDAIAKRRTEKIQAELAARRAAADSSASS